MSTLRTERVFGMVCVIVHISHVTSTALQSLHFATPGVCRSNQTFNESFLMSTYVTRNRVECGNMCANDENCRSFVVSGQSPNVQCRLYEQGTNQYGIYLQPDPQSHYMEKLGVHGRGTVEHCLNQTTGNKRDPNGPCARVNAWLYVGERLLPGEYMCSFNLVYRLILRPEDGNLIVRNMWNNTIQWMTNVSPPGFPTHHATLLPDGNLVLQDSKGNIGWSSNTPPCTALFMVLQGKTGTLKTKNANASLECWEIA